MQPVLTPEQMAAADERTIAAGTPIDVLMERAGQAVAWAVRRRLRGLYGRRVVVACGKGNNGGDGLVAARVLRAWGARVDVVSIADGPGALDLDPTALARAVARADVAVDAMYGTGFRGALADGALLVADTFAAGRVPVVAVDIPSGVDGMTGEVRGTAVDADETVCFAAWKPGLLFEPGRSHAGAVRVVDLGIDTSGLDGGAPSDVVDGADVGAWITPRAPDAHKWRSGAYVVGGSSGMTGAPALVSHAAMRSGAGIVWCGVPGADAAARAAGSEVIAKGLAADAQGALSTGAADEVLEALGRFRALAVGPGAGRAFATQDALRRIVAEAPVPVVVDADALHAVAGEMELLRSRPAPTVLTPHEAEFAAVGGAPVAADRVASARTLAASSGAVVLLKGPTTVVAAPGGRVAIVASGGVWLATAGTGDVLTGMVLGLLARGLPAFEAAAGAAFLHGAAANVAGHTGLMAGDLVGAIPAALDGLPR